MRELAVPIPGFAKEREDTMKKLLYLIAISIFVVATLSPGVGVAQEEHPTSPLDSPKIFMPMVLKQHSYTVAGQIKDMYDMPVGGVTVQSDSGQTTVTDKDGIYSMQVIDGQRQIFASKDGYDLEPAVSNIFLNKDAHNMSFTAVSACSAPIPNPSFEIPQYYWNPISGNANGATPFYSTARANTGSVSGFTGLQDSFPSTNRVSWSRWRSHEFVIPSDASSATVQMFYWPYTSESVALSIKQLPNAVGFDTAAPDAPTLIGDFQYIALIDANTNYILGYLMQVRRNDQVWVDSSAISMLAFANTNRSVKLEFGTYNDGLVGVTNAFFDDVVVNVCADSITYTGCQNLLGNSEFEAVGNWNISLANIQSAYTNQYYYSPGWSMLSGVPVGVINPFPHQFTTSEFWQPTTVAIPSNANYARLKVRMLPRSSDLWGYHLTEQAELTKQSLQSQLSGPSAVAAPDAVESQYLHIRDAADTLTLAQLVKWFPVDSYNWLYREYDLLPFRGQTISVLFGAANDGWDGNTALYVDDVFLEACAP